MTAILLVTSKFGTKLIIYMAYKLVGIHYPTYYDRALSRRIDPVVKVVEDKIQIKPMIEEMLFESAIDQRINGVLVKWANVMYLCEPVNTLKREFVKTEVTYHPYQQLA